MATTAKPTTTRGVAAAAAAGALLVAAGCGSGGTGLEAVASDPVAAFAAALEGSQSVASGRFELRNETSGGPMSMVMTSEGSWSGDRTAMSVHLDGDGVGALWGVDELAYITTPSTHYVSGAMLGSDAEWVAIDVSDREPATSESLGFGDALDPDALFGTLGAAAHDVEEAGTGEVRGEPTTVYAVETTLDELVDEGLSDEERAQVEDVAGIDAVGRLGELVAVDVTFTVDVGDDGLVRRIAMSWHVEASGELEALGGMTTTQVVEFYDLGAAVVIDEPADAEPVGAGVLGNRVDPSGSTSTTSG